MKKLILIMAVLFMASCSTITKVGHKLTTSRDSSSAVKKDTSSVVKKDSTAHTIDESVITTKEHIVNDFTTPGNYLINQVKFNTLFSGPKTVVSGDGTDSLELTYNKKDSTFTATLRQKPTAHHQTIDRTIVNQQHKTLDTKTAETIKSKGSTDIKTKVVSKSKLDDTSKTIKRSMFSTPLFIISIIAFVFALALIILFKFKIL